MDVGSVSPSERCPASLFASAPSRRLPFSAGVLRAHAPRIVVRRRCRRRSSSFADGPRAARPRELGPPPLHRLRFVAGGLRASVRVLRDRHDGRRCAALVRRHPRAGPRCRRRRRRAPSPSSSPSWGVVVVVVAVVGRRRRRRSGVVSVARARARRWRRRHDNSSGDRERVGTLSRGPRAAAATGRPTAWAWRVRTIESATTRCRQVWLARVALREMEAARGGGGGEEAAVKVRNVVFMGMGEPLDNWPAVLDALRGLTHQARVVFSPLLFSSLLFFCHPCSPAVCSGAWCAAVVLRFCSCPPSCARPVGSVAFSVGQRCAS